MMFITKMVMDGDMGYDDSRDRDDGLKWSWNG